MFLLYDLIFLAVSLIYLPIYLFKRKFHRGFIRRLGFLPRDLKLGRPIWIHAVSVGEAILLQGLVEELRKAYPQKKFVISTVTATGNKIAKNIARDDDFVTYLPLDFSFIIGPVIDKIKPEIFIIAETEIWPNLISTLHKRKIPVVIINGRISDRSFSGYQRIRFFLKPILNKITQFCVQGETDFKRLLKLGVSRELIKVTGNMKFDLALDLQKDYPEYRKMLGLGQEIQLLVAGSTHPKEEEIILNAYRQILKEFPRLRLLIAPRHPQRSKDVAKTITKFGFQAVLFSHPVGPINNPVFILDTIGDLIPFYNLADIVFVGGSLIKQGGHNILEPASLAKPVLFGPQMFNFRDIANLFLNHKAAILVRNEEELKLNISCLLNQPAKLLELGERARQIVLHHQGATARNVQYIKIAYERNQR